MTWSEILIPSIASLAGALIGGTIAGFCSIRAVKTAHEMGMKVQEKNQEKIIQGLLQAIHDEIETLYDMFRERAGNTIETLTDNQALLYYYPISHDYFTVYNGNSFLIGHIPSNDLRKAIVTTYTMAKGLVDSLRLNNEFIQKYEHWIMTYQQTNVPLHQTFANNQLFVLIEYAKKIKFAYNQLKVSVNELLRDLRKSGVLYERKTK
jgi:hypothetical protein